MTNVSEKTMAVSAIMPDAMDEYIAVAADALMSDIKCGKKRVSSLGSARPAAMAHAA
jgi:hypothetical protein